MKNKITISLNDYSFDAQLNDTMTVKKIMKILPIESEISLWGDEIYFTIDVNADLENQKQELEVGEIAFWPQGNAFCIFFGKTPASIADKPRAVGPVTPIGNIIGSESIEILKKASSSDIIKINLADERRNKGN